MMQVCAGLIPISSCHALRAKLELCGEQDVGAGLQTLVAKYLFAMRQVYRRAIAGKMHGFLALGPRADHHLRQSGLERGKTCCPARSQSTQRQGKRKEAGQQKGGGFPYHWASMS